MIKLKNIYIYFLLTIFATYTGYTFLWTRFGLGVTLGVQYLFLLLILVGLAIYLIKGSKCRNSWANWLILLWIIQLFAFFIEESNATTQLKETTYVLLIPSPLIAINYSTKKIKPFFLVIALISITMYFITMSWIRFTGEASYGGGYMILVALPVFLYFFRNKGILMQLGIIMVLFFLVLTSMKRGDILAAILGLIVFFFVKFKGTEGLNFRKLVLVAVTVLIGYFSVRYLLDNNELFATRFQQTLDGHTSNRDIIYLELWNYFIDAPIGVQLLGGGFDATLNVISDRAHSDLLEVLICEGLLGLLIYLGAYVSLFLQTCRRADITEKAILSLILAIWTVKMIFSMFIYSQPTIILFALAAYILNKDINKKYEY